MSLLCPGARCVFPAVVAAASLAACGGGGGPAPAAQPTQAPPAFVLPTPGPARSYSGTRTIVVTGTPMPGWPGAGTYAVSGTEQDVVPGPGAPSGTALERRMQRSFTGPLPAAGVAPQSESRVDDVAFTPAGIAVLQTSDTRTGRDLDAERSLPSTQFTDTSTVVTTYPPNALVAPANVVPAQFPFPLASTAHLTDRSAGTNGATSRGFDYTRVTNADGSFDETGRFNDVGDHAMHQHADGSATSHDQVPGFFLRDVSVSAPSGSTMTVTTQTQGRTIGNPPVVTTTYTTPVWYRPGPLASATLFVTPSSSATECNGTPGAVLGINLARGRNDVPAGVSFVENDIAYVDATGLVVCRVTSDVTFAIDVTTGAITGSLDDRTVVHFTGSAPSSALTSARRGTR